jgi:cytidylate kinase
VPVITIDGTAGSGKGVISAKLAKELGWHFLDSGVIYRALALLYIDYLSNNFPGKSIDTNSIGTKADITADLISATLSQLGPQWEQNDPNNQSKLLCELAADLQLEIKQDQVYLFFANNNQGMVNVTAKIRTESCANLASQLAVIPAVRQALLDKQRKFRVLPGLVADGRDMGTVVFPEAIIKFFIDADPEIRAKRRYLQLKELGVGGNLHNHIEELSQRDVRDAGRAIAPLQPAEDAIVIDTTAMTINEVFTIVVNQVKLVV